MVRRCGKSIQLSDRCTPTPRVGGTTLTGCLLQQARVPWHTERGGGGGGGGWARGHRGSWAPHTPPVPKGADTTTSTAKLAAGRPQHHMHRALRGASVNRLGPRPQGTAPECACARNIAAADTTTRPHAQAARTLRRGGPPLPCELASQVLASSWPRDCELPCRWAAPAALGTAEGGPSRRTYVRRLGSPAARMCPEPPPPTHTRERRRLNS